MLVSEEIQPHENHVIHHRVSSATMSIEEKENKPNKSDETQERKRKEISETITEWAIGTTPHGLANIFYNKNIALKLIWLVFLLAAFGYCFQQTVVTIKEYYKHEVLTSISIVDQAPALFPAVKKHTIYLKHLIKKQKNDLL